MDHAFKNYVVAGSFNTEDALKFVPEDSGPASEAKGISVCWLFIIENICMYSD